MYNLAIIGGGPAGYVAAERAGKAGLRVVLFEKKELGGVCLNEGCIPTKTLLHSAKLLEQTRHADKFGIETDGISFDYSRIQTRKDKVVKKLVGGIKVSMRNAGVTVIKAEVRIEGGAMGGFTLLADGEEYIAEKILLCPGSRTFVPDIEWLRPYGDKIITSTEALGLNEVPESLSIVGGGVIGMEFAGLFNALGSRVTVYELQDEILGTMDREVAATLRGIYASRGVKFVLGGTPEDKGDLAASARILLCVGRKPNTENLGLETLGITLDKRGAVIVDEHMRTNVRGIYAAGDVTGKFMLAHVASREAEVAAADILGTEDRMTYDAIPSVVYTIPELASIGLTEQQAQSEGIGYGVKALPLTYSGKFVAQTERETGLCKILYDKADDKIIGVHILGGPCSEIISACCVAMQHGMTTDMLRRLILPHPSVGEIIKEVSWSDDIPSK